jgi:Tfp pilus assembly protein PilX
MTAIPSLPTDNLYKFCAVTGVILIVLSVSATWLRIGSLARKNVFMSSAERNVDAAKNLAEALLKANEQNVRALSRVDEKARPPEQEFKFTQDTIALLDRTYTLQKEETQMLIEVKEAFIVRNEAIFVGWVSVLGLVSGAVLGVYGFVNWRKLQLIQDRLLSKQLHARSSA